MTDATTVGRHRSPLKYSPVSELTTVLSRVGESGVKASAVLAASGGLVAGVAVPAQAAPIAPVTGGPAPAPIVGAAAPAVVAPAVDGPVTVETFGVVGVGAVGAAPVVVAARTRGAQAQVSRSTTRTATAAAPAPAVALPPSVSGIVNIARQFFGVPYVYGGSSPSGFDCSGFTSYVYARAGISIPRTASAQQRAAVRVSNPQPGDLVFFGYPAYHVGIYIGGGQMIDSAHTGTVISVRTIWTSNVTYGRF